MAGLGNSSPVLCLGLSTAGQPGWVRLQAWLGAIPLAGYLVLHLAAQASALWGPRAHAASALAAPAAGRWLALEIVLVYLPLLAHAVLGLCRIASGQGRGDSTWAGADGRRLQRLSGGVLFVFLSAHLWQFPWRLWTGELARSDYYFELCASLSSTAWGGVPWVAGGYLLGIGAAAAHGAQGLYHAGPSLGLINAARERLWAICCGALGVALFVLGALIVIDLATGSVLIHFSRL